MAREQTLHYGYVHLFSPREIRQIGEHAGLRPVAFRSSISSPEVWLAGYPVFVRWPARLAFGALRVGGYFGRRVGYAFEKPGMIRVVMQGMGKEQRMPRIQPVEPNNVPEQSR